MTKDEVKAKWVEEAKARGFMPQMMLEAALSRDDIIRFIFDKAIETAARVEALENELKISKAIIDAAEDKLRECGLAFEGLAQLELADLKKKIEAFEAANPPAIYVTMPDNPVAAAAIVAALEALQHAHAPRSIVVAERTAPAQSLATRVKNGSLGNG